MYQRTVLRIHPLPGERQHKIVAYECYLFEIARALSVNGWQARSGFPGCPDRSYRVEADVPEADQQEALPAFLLTLPNVIGARWEEGQVVVDVKSYRWPNGLPNTVHHPRHGLVLDREQTNEMLQKTKRVRQCLDHADVSRALTYLGELEALIRDAGVIAQ